jgi:exopolysaccharide biosynthesis polyprenyl glycosylphosphotransferase
VASQDGDRTGQVISPVSVAVPSGSVGPPSGVLTAPPEPATEVSEGRLAPLRRHSLQRRTLALADMLAVVVTYVFVSTVVHSDVTRTGRLALLAGLPFFLLLNKLLGLYDRDADVINKSTLDELPRLLQSVALGGGLIFLVWPLIPGVEIGRAECLAFIPIALLCTVVFRSLARASVANTLPPERCLIVGSGRVARQLAAKIRDHDEDGVELVGFVDAARLGGDLEADVNILGDMHEFERVCRALTVDRVVIAFSNVSHEEMLHVVEAATELQVKVSIVPRLFEGVGQVVEIDDVHGITLHGLRGLTRTRSSLRLKRAIDVAIASAGLLVLSPLFAVVALWIKISSPGPVLFAQWRVGQNNKPFRIFKFRTMYEGADHMKAELRHLNEASGPMFKIAADPRVTTIGRILRRYSIDELPQLLNVLRGEMSLVGPRPLVPDEADAVIGRHRARLKLTPGLTGPWQVMGRTAVPFDEMIKLDYLFVSEWSLWNDMKLILRTLPVVVRGSGQ